MDDAEMVQPHYLIINEAIRSVCVLSFRDFHASGDKVVICYDPQQANNYLFVSISC